MSPLLAAHNSNQNWLDEKEMSIDNAMWVNITAITQYNVFWQSATIVHW